MLYLSDIKKRFKVSFVHNPDGFFQNSFWIEQAPNGQMLLMGNSRNKKKNFKKVAILKKKEKKIGVN